MKRFFICLGVCILLVACGGVPLRSLPKLMQLSQQLLEANPAEFRVALQVDARLVPAAGAVPLLIVKVEPRTAGDFDVIDKKLPLQLSVASVSTLGLEAPPRGRRWLIYSMPPQTQVELQRVQETVRQARAVNQATGKAKGGGSLSLGLEQDSLASSDPALADTPWSTWIQTRQSDGFFEAWTGTLAQLRKVAAEKRADKPQ